MRVIVVIVVMVVMAVVAVVAFVAFSVVVVIVAAAVSVLAGCHCTWPGTPPWLAGHTRPPAFGVCRRRPPSARSEKEEDGVEARADADDGAERGPVVRADAAAVGAADADADAGRAPWGFTQQHLRGTPRANAEGPVPA